MLCTTQNKNIPHIPLNERNTIHDCRKTDKQEINEVNADK